MIKHKVPGIQQAYCGPLALLPSYGTYIFRHNTTKGEQRSTVWQEWTSSGNDWTLFHYRLTASSVISPLLRHQLSVTVSLLSGSSPADNHWSFISEPTQQRQQTITAELENTSEFTTHHLAPKHTLIQSRSEQLHLSVVIKPTDGRSSNTE